MTAVLFKSLDKQFHSPDYNETNLVFLSVSHVDPIEIFVLGVFHAPNDRRHSISWLGAIRSSDVTNAARSLETRLTESIGFQTDFCATE